MYGQSGRRVTRAARFHSAGQGLGPGRWTILRAALSAGNIPFALSHHRTAAPRRGNTVRSPRRLDGFANNGAPPSPFSSSILHVVLFSASHSSFLLDCAFPLHLSFLLSCLSHSPYRCSLCRCSALYPPLRRDHRRDIAGHLSSPKRLLITVLLSCFAIHLPLAPGATHLFVQQNVIFSSNLVANR